MSPKRHGSPLRLKMDSLPVTAEVEKEVDVKGIAPSCPRAGADDEGAVSSTETNRTVGQSSSDDPSSQMSCDPIQKSCDPPLDDSMPSVQSSDSRQRTLPPVPNRLIPSSSTERIMEILNQHDVKKEAMQGSLAEERKQAPLSSTPAYKAQDRARSSQVGKLSPCMQLTMVLSPYQMNSFVQDIDRLSLASQMSIQDGTFLGDARHKDGSLMAVVFQVRAILHT